MATKPYWLSFGNTAITGLAPTFIQFRTTAGSTLPPPGITAPGAFGLYSFEYEALTQVAFVCDGATTGLASGTRYIVGVLDPFDLFGYTLNTIGASLSVQGGSLATIGNSLSAFYPLALAGLSQGVENYSLSVNSYSLLIASASLIGTTGATFGGTATDPVSVFGFLKRAQETREGNETYTKADGTLDTYSRGSSYLLIEKTISDNLTETTKT